VFPEHRDSFRQAPISCHIWCVYGTSISKKVAAADPEHEKATKGPPSFSLPPSRKQHDRGEAAVVSFSLSPLARPHGE
jgi:hypothetical protein